MDVQVPLPDGTTRAGTLALPPGRPRGGVVLLHGFASDRREFADAADLLAAKGWAALAMDFRAHDAAATLAGKVDTATVEEDLRAAGAFLRKQAGDVPLGLVAHSMGGALAAHALPRLPEFRAAVLVAPMDTIEGELGRAEFVAYKAAIRASRASAKLGLGPIVIPYKYTYKDLLDDPEAVKRAEAIGFLGRRVSLAGADALLAMRGAAWAREVKVPTLVLLAANDRAVKHDSSKRVYEALAGPKRLVEVSSGHSVFGDRRAAEVADIVHGWFAANLG